MKMMREMRNLSNRWFCCDFVVFIDIDANTAHRRYLVLNVIPVDKRVLWTNLSVTKKGNINSVLFIVENVMKPDSDLINSIASSADLPTNSGQHVFDVNVVISVQMKS